MPTIEERLQALEQEHERLHSIEQEHTQLKKTIELQTIAIRALVSKEAFEKLQETIEKSQEQNIKLFDVLIAHDRLTNGQLAELRTQHIETDGKITGLQTEIRQHFTEQDGKIVRVQAEMRQSFNELNNKMETKEDIRAMENRILDTFKQILTAITTQTKNDEE